MSLDNEVSFGKNEYTSDNSMLTVKTIEEFKSIFEKLSSDNFGRYPEQTEPIEGLQQSLIKLARQHDSIVRNWNNVPYLQEILKNRDTIRLVNTDIKINEVWVLRGKVAGIMAENLGIVSKYLSDLSQSLMINDEVSKDQRFVQGYIKGYIKNLHNPYNIKFEGVTNSHKEAVTMALESFNSHLQSLHTFLTSDNISVTLDESIKVALLLPSTRFPVEDFFLGYPFRLSVTNLQFQPQPEGSGVKGSLSIEFTVKCDELL